jgi:hypothetical protein
MAPKGKKAAKAPKEKKAAKAKTPVPPVPPVPLVIAQPDAEPSVDEPAEPACSLYVDAVVPSDDPKRRRLIRRDTEEQCIRQSPPPLVYVYIYIHIYIYTYMHIYIYILYLFSERDRVLTDPKI